MDFYGNMGFFSHVIHSAVLVCVFGVQMALLYMVMRKYAETKDARLIFLGMAVSASATYSLFHSLMIPDDALFTEGLFDIFEGYGMILSGATFLIGAVLRMGYREGLHRFRRGVVGLWALGGLSGVIALIFQQKLQDILFLWSDYVAGASSILMLLAAIFFFRSSRIFRERTDSSMAVGLLILAGAGAGSVFCEKWGIWWWSSHGLLLIGNTVMLSGFIVDGWLRRSAVERPSVKIPFYRRIQFRPAALTLFLAVFPILLMGIYSFFVAERVLGGQATKSLEHLAESNAAHVRTLIHAMENVAADFSSDGMIRELSREIASPSEETMDAAAVLGRYLVESKLPVNRYLVGINILDVQGKVVASTNDAEIGRDASRNPRFGEILHLPFGDSMIVGYGKYTDFRDGTRLLAIAAPIRGVDGGGQSSGVVVTFFELESVPLLLGKESHSTEKFDTYLVDEDGALIGESLFSKEHAGLSWAAGVEPVSACRNSRNASGPWKNWRGEGVYGASICFSDLPFRWTMIVETDEASVLDPVSDLKDLMVIAAAVLGIFATFSALILTSGPVGSLRKLSRFAREINQGNLDARVDIDSGDEIEALAKDLDRMRQTIGERESNLKKINAGLMQMEWEMKMNIGNLEDSKRAVMNLFEDVNESNLLIEAQKERSESILRFLRSIGDGIVAVDHDRKIVFMNEAAEKLIGKTFEESNGRYLEDIADFFTEADPPSKCVCPLEKVIDEEQKMLFPENLYILGAGGVKIDISGDASPIRDAKGAVVGGIVTLRDVTEKMAIERTKDRFLSVAAHQLRTPLGSMRWNMEMLLAGDFGKLPKAATEATKQLYDNSSRLITVVNDLLDVARINQKKTDEPASPTDILKIIGDVVETLRPDAEKFGVTVIQPSQEAFPDIMLAPKRFYEVITNLVSNAIKYNRRGGTVTIALEQDQDRTIRISVADTGIGIPKSDQEKIFSKFFRAGNAVLKETDGSGLGLFVVKSFVEADGGTIRFESEDGKGSVFLIEWPRPERREGEDGRICFLPTRPEHKQ